MKVLEGIGELKQGQEELKEQNRLTKRRADAIARDVLGLKESNKSLAASLAIFTNSNEYNVNVVRYCNESAFIEFFS